MEACSWPPATKEKDDSWIRRAFAQVASSYTSRACKALLVQPAEHANGVTQLASLVDDIIDHLRFELAVLDLYLPTLLSLHLESNAQMRTITEEIYGIAVAATQGQSYFPSLVDVKERSLIRLLSSSAKASIALARQEYGLLTLLALTSYALLSALQERKENILVLQSSLDGLKERMSEFSNGSCTSPLCVTTMAREVYDRLPTVAELDRTTNEKRPSAKTIRSSALEWMKRHALEQRDQAGNNNNPADDALRALPFGVPTTGSRNTSTTSTPQSHSSQPAAPPNTHTSAAAAVRAVRLYNLTWLHRTVGAASWHWQGSSSCPIFLRKGPYSCSDSRLEAALLFAGLDLPDLHDYSGFLGKDDTWEDYRYGMPPRGDAAYLLVCWPTNYTAPNVEWGMWWRSAYGGDRVHKERLCIEATAMPISYACEARFYTNRDGQVQQRHDKMIWSTKEENNLGIWSNFPLAHVSADS
ncbi:unnamed protein product [Zymoseptoria tritici ST99CH_1E4]|uniref:Uncharacterized protein n=1 Tax=Zymoseptoria tritici ST99CH_1E4 TaxID=1276532 RepID=A0A2H1H9P7_ZYMTR|nr:unnamed protein product [Zymoseptoria tritici ST99CH_1E4]